MNFTVTLQRLTKVQQITFAVNLTYKSYPDITFINLRSKVLSDNYSPKYNLFIEQFANVL